MKKLIVDCKTSTDNTVCKLSGIIDEDFSPEQFKIVGETVIFDFKDLEAMNSCGIREWIKFIDSLKGKKLIYENCPRLLVDQMNMIKGFLPKGTTVASVYAPFFSSAEGEEIDLLIPLKDFNEGKLKTQTHPQKGTPLEFDDIPSQYFAFLKVLG